MRREPKPSQEQSSGQEGCVNKPIINVRFHLANDSYCPRIVGNSQLSAMTSSKTYLLMRISWLCTFVFARFLLLDLVHCGEGMAVDVTKRSATTNNNNVDKPKIGASPRSAASFALLETMTKKNEKKQEFAIRMLEKNRGFLVLEDRDRAFARLLLSTTERRLGQIDKVIDAFVKKPLSKGRLSDVLCQAVLRIGAAQLLFIDLPDYAVVSETVEVLRQHPKIKVSKTQISFVNAVLRSIGRKGMDVLDGSTSVLDNISPWLANEWIKAYGKEKTEKMVQVAMSQSPIFVSVNELKSDVKTVQEAFDTQSAMNDRDDADKTTNLSEVLSIGCIRVPDHLGSVVSRWPLYKEGAWWVQDPSATLPAIALKSALINTKNADNKAIHDMLVVDLCSAPGGKTAQLCSIKVGGVDAVEISKARSKSLHQNLERLGMQDVCQVSVEDGRVWMPEKENDIPRAVDAVLLDAPCSATGVGSRRPDVLRKVKQVEDIQELIAMQKELMLHTVDDILQADGILVYATCSLLPQEGEEQIEWLLKERKDAVEMIPFEKNDMCAHGLAGLEDCVAGPGWLRVLPGVLDGSLQHCDGFFVARIRRV